MDLPGLTPRAPLFLRFIHRALASLDPILTLAVFDLRGSATEPYSISTLDNIAVANLPETTGPLDARVLAELAAMQRNGRPGFMQRVIALYLQTAAELIKELEAASVSNEASTLYRASHTLKPCSATVGALSLASLCEALESATRRGSIPDPAARVEAIADEYKRVEAALAGFDKDPRLAQSRKELTNSIEDCRWHHSGSAITASEVSGAESGDDERKEQLPPLERR
jgi:HPt (histidine-containing phosphotransfer) domain-containing protein